MASPFTFFRRNQRSMMVVLVIVAMLVFTMETVFSSNDRHFVILGAVLGGFFLAIAGITRGLWMQYGFGGAVLGALCGWVMPGLILSPYDRETAVVSSLGLFDSERVSVLSQKRNVANQFIFHAFEQAFGEGTGQFASRNSFGFGQGSTRGDLIFGEILRAEADRMGLVVTNEMVSNHINRVTFDKLSTQGFATARKQLRFQDRAVTEEQLFDLLRDEIKPMLAYQVLQPQFSSMPPGPEAYYNAYRRLHVTQRLNTVALDVDGFLPKVSEPSDAEVGALFASALTKFPNEDSPGSPGFRQPLKVKLGYLEVSRSKIEPTIAAVTDEEIQKQYDENKDTLYRRPVAPETTPADNATPAAPETPADNATPAAPEAPATSETPATTPETPAAPEQPAEPAAPALETPATPSEPAPADGAGSGSETSANPEAPKETPAQDPPAQPQSSTRPAVPGESAELVASTSADSGRFLLTALAQDAAAPATESKPEEPAAPTEPAAADAAATTPAEPAATTPAASETVPAKKESITIPDAATAPAGAVPEAPKASADFPEQKFETRPLDDELKGEIREQLTQRRISEAMTAKAMEILKFMKKLESERRSYRFSLNDPEKPSSPEDVSAKMLEHSKGTIEAAKAFAEKAGVTYVETPYVTFEQLSRAEDYPIGAATPPGANPFQQSGPDVANSVFSGPTDELQHFIPRQAQRTSFSLENDDAQYVWWIMGMSPPHYPTLDEPGIREEVVLTWKRLKARELAQARGEEIAKLIREAMSKPEDQRQEMAAAIESLTLLGDADSPKLVSRQTLPFTWVRQQMTPAMNFQQQQSQLTMSEISFADGSGDQLEMAYDEFMNRIFNEMKNDEVGVVPVFDRSRFYVVQVVERSPTPEVGEEELRQRFLTEGRKFATSGSPIISMVRQAASGSVSMEWQKSLWQKYEIDPETLAESEAAMQ